MKPLQINISTPGHSPNTPPDHERIGSILDNVIKEHFMGKKVVVRYIGSQDHPGMDLDELVKVIVDTGSDKYDKTRIGVGYDDFRQKGVKIDFYGELIDGVTENTSIMSQMIYEMYHSAIGDRGYGVHVDIVLIYDAEQLDMITDLYESQVSSDGFVFKNPELKRAALIGVVKIL